MQDIIQVYPGSACQTQRGPGAWATLLSCGRHQKELFGNADVTTNNRMCLIAVIKGLRSLKAPSAVHVITYSQYVQKGASEWLKKWKADGRLSVGGVENVELWCEIDRLSHIHFIDWIWQSGNDNPTIHQVNAIARQSLANFGKTRASH